MSPDERQAAIWDIVFQRNYETVPNLACELGVTTRTIYEDLSRMKGKYAGQNWNTNFAQQGMPTRQPC